MTPTEALRKIQAALNRLNLVDDWMDGCCISPALDNEDTPSRKARCDLHVAIDLITQALKEIPK